MAIRRSLEQIYDEEQLSTLYAIAPCPEWEYWSPDALPRPIQEWITEHYPEITVERSVGFEVRYAGQGAAESDDGRRKALLFHPVFQIGFTDEQARHFEEAWSVPPLKPSNGTENFYFLVCGPGEETAILDDQTAGVQAER